MKIKAKLSEETLEKLKGEKGDSPVAGVDYEIPQDGKDGKNPDPNLIAEMVQSKIPTPKDGKSIVGPQGPPGEIPKIPKIKDFSKEIKTLQNRTQLLNQIATQNQRAYSKAEVDALIASINLSESIPLTDLSDATITGTPADNELLAYDSGSGEWINQTAAEAGISIDELNDIGDVTITSVAGGEIIKWSGSAWVNNTLVEANIGGLSIANTWTTAQTVTASSGDLLRVNPSGTARGLVVRNTGTNKDFLIDHDLTNTSSSENTVAWQSASVVDNAGTYTKSGSTYLFNSTVTETSGTITDTANLLTLEQLHAQSSGSVLNIANSGTGDAIEIDNGNIAMGDNSVTGIDTLAFTDSAGTIAGIQNQNLLDKTDTETISGSYTFTNPVLIDLDANEQGLRIQAHSSQTVDLFVIENHAGADLFAVQDDGIIVVGDGSLSGDRIIEFYNENTKYATFGFDDSRGYLGIDFGTGAVDAATSVISIDTDKVGFFDQAPVAQPTGVAVTAAGIHAALVTLGLITA